MSQTSIRSGLATRNMGGGRPLRLDLPTFVTKSVRVHSRNFCCISVWRRRNVYGQTVYLYYIYAFKRTRLQNLSWGCFNLPFAFLCVLVRFLPWEINVDIITFEIDSNYTYFKLVWDKLPIYERIFVLLVRETFKDDAVKAHTADESDAGGHWLQGHEMSGPSWTWQRWHFQSTIQASSHDLGAIAKGPTKGATSAFWC